MTAPERTLTHRRVVAIAVPIVLSNATVPILGAVDTGVIGQLGEAAPIGAVGIGAVILASLYWIFGFLRMGTSGLVAQSHGAGDGGEASAHLLRGLAIGIGVGLALIAAHPLLFGAAFRLAPASAEVETLAETYLRIRILAAPATIALYAINGWLIALERTRAVFALQLLQNGLNVALDVIFVLGLGLGVAGVAWASFIAEYGGLLLGLWFCRHAFRTQPGLGALFRRAPMMRMLRVNSDIMVRSVLLQGCFTGFIFLGAAEGDVTLAANQVLLQFLEFVSFALDGFAFAAESLVGQAIGARKPRMLRDAVRLTAIWGLIGALALSGVFFLFGAAIIDLLTTAEPVRAEAYRYLPWLIAAPVLGVAGWMFDGIFIGAARTREMRLAMIQSVAIYLVALALLMPVWGNHGLWMSLMALNAMRGLLMARYYPRVVASAAPGGRA